MDNWKAGDTALCVNIGKLPHQDSEIKNLPALRLKAKYMVNTIHTCSCGSISLDIGLAIQAGGIAGVRCGCGAISAPSDIHWCASERFVKEIKNEASNEAVNAELEEAVKSGDMDRVDELLDKMKK